MGGGGAVPVGKEGPITESAMLLTVAERLRGSSLSLFAATGFSRGVGLWGTASLFGLTNMDCAGSNIGDTAQQYPGGIVGSGQVDPDIDDTAANEGTHREGGGVFKPTKSSPGESADSPKDGQNQQRSGAAETTSEQRRLSR
ncbi:hypothetical protein NDU88_003031 [Pleurodeles waltl]|uniref:Uncharacterized protein n=1 Tax=Pleurodeles waltl TaxID=8319 RepID=A0AAV7NPT2_PLEWA|nr:hypothetical protein NDU88_003031 [Pleurodeles waltl]